LRQSCVEDYFIVNDLKRLARQFWIELIERKLPLETETSWFLMVSSLDFIMTYLLLVHPEIHFVETNPIALFFYYRWGFKGLLGFKLFMAAFVAILCQIIARKKRNVARRVLQVGTLIVGIVVVYSLCLYARGGSVL
jgi:hypothetical protein